MNVKMRMKMKMNTNGSRIARRFPVHIPMPHLAPSPSQVRVAGNNKMQGLVCCGSGCRYRWCCSFCALFAIFYITPFFGVSAHIARFHLKSIF